MKLKNYNLCIYDVTAAVFRFIERVYVHVTEKFPDGELHEWFAFDTQANRAQTKFNFCKEDVEELIKKYKHFLTQDTSTSMSSEYNEFKFVVKEKLKAGSLQTFAEIVLSEDKFSKLENLIEIISTFQAPSAFAERGFSLIQDSSSKLNNVIDWKSIIWTLDRC